MTVKSTTKIEFKSRAKNKMHTHTYIQIYTSHKHYLRSPSSHSRSVRGVLAFVFASNLDLPLTSSSPHHPPSLRILLFVFCECVYKNVACNRKANIGSADFIFVLQQTTEWTQQRTRERERDSKRKKTRFVLLCFVYYSCPCFSRSRLLLFMWIPDTHTHTRWNKTTVEGRGWVEYDRKREREGEAKKHILEVKKRAPKHGSEQKKLCI